MTTAEANLTTRPRRKRLSPQRQRNLIAQTIERLLDLLDAIDPEADDEPSLGWNNQGSQERVHSSPGDREWDCEDEGAEHDGCEPWGMNILGGGL
jgi:hypothetical protein